MRFSFYYEDIFLALGKEIIMKETIKRAARTFLQAAVGYIATNLAIYAGEFSDMNVLKTALIGLCVSAVAAGLAAVMNLPAGGEI